MSRFLNLSDKKTANLFADGAGAALLTSGDQHGFLASSLRSSGEFHDALGIYTGGVYRPCTPENLKLYGPPSVEFVRKFPKTFNTEHWPELIYQTLQKTGLTFDDIDLYLFTQLNLRTIEAMMQIINQPIEKTHWIMHKWGYTGSPCVIMALDDLIDQGRGPQPGQNVLFCTSGGGISMAVSVWRWV
jgi:3-oxoacyl-[acyl-carrier-protein] synthase III